MVTWQQVGGDDRQAGGDRPGTCGPRWPLGKYLSGHTTGRATQAGRPYTRVGSDDIVRDVVAISREIGCSPPQVAISWLRQQPGTVIPQIAARTEHQFPDNLPATPVPLTHHHLHRPD